MASITSLMNSSSSSSIYGSRNILSGLASGMDTETMIENAVSGIKRKIQSLYQKRTKVEWQQEAYRSIIDKAVNLNNKYTSYSSKTNLLSSSFFNNAVLTTVNGTYANKISASGKTSSDIKINAVKQVATAASYSVSGMSTPFSGASGAITGKDFDITKSTTVSNVSGSLTFEYGGANGASFDIHFDELENLDEIEVLNDDGSVKSGASNAEKLAQAIKNKLSEITYNYTDTTGSNTTTADKAIKVSVENGEIKFSDGLDKGNSVSISSAVGDIKDTLGISNGDNSIKVTYDTKLTKSVDTAADYLSKKTLGVTFNGATKNISLGSIVSKLQSDIKKLNSAELSDEERKAKIEEINGKFKDALQKELDNNFGTGKISVSYDGGRLSFTPQGEGDTLSLGGSAIEALGFENGASNFVNTSKSLGDIMGDKSGGFFKTANRMKAEGYVTPKTNSDGTYYVDSKGNRVEKADDGSYYQIDNDGNAIYDFEINGVHIGVTENTTLEGLMNSINSNADMGVKVSYSKLTNEFKFTASETGANSRIEFGGLAKEIFNPSSGIKSTDKFSDAYDLNLQDGEKKWIRFEANGKEFTSFSIGSNALLSGDASIEDVIKEINDNPMRYTAAYDESTGKITVTDRNGNEMELTVKISGDMDGKENVEEVQSKFNGGTFTAGQDAVMDVEINGKRFENLSRSSNVFDIDGMNITVKGTFDESAFKPENGEDYEPVTFETVTDSDKIVEAIRSFVNDYNEMVTELKGAYSTQPAYKSGTTRYEPLTAEEEEGYTESQLAAYNEKAKQGILFGDTTLSSMYGKLLNAIAPGGVDGQTLREIGIGTSYENGLTTLSLDEDKLRAALDSDPDKVKNAFTKTTEGGSSSNGLMQTLQNTLNTYVKTTGESKGVLITKAGSIKAPTSLNNNSLNTQINNIDKQISRWQNKMSSQIDRYTKQFSKLEQLVAAMNSQASALSGLMGGYEGY